MNGLWNDDQIIADMEFLFGGHIPPGVASQVHKDGIPDLTRLETADTLYFVIGSYEGDKKMRVKKVRDKLSEPDNDEAFILEEIDPTVDVWENFYVKFRVFLMRCHYVVAVFEDNRGGHELELGESDLAESYVLKRDYENESVERDHYDAMLSTLFELLDKRGHLHRWTSENELLKETQKLGSVLGSAIPP